MEIYLLDISSCDAVKVFTGSSCVLDRLFERYGLSERVTKVNGSVSESDVIPFVQLIRMGFAVSTRFTRVYMSF